MNNITSIQLEEIISQGESDFIDFKEKWHQNNARLIHDILCLANANTIRPTDRMLVIGVSDENRNIVDISHDPNRKKSHEVHDLFNKIINHRPVLKTR